MFENIKELWGAWIRFPQVAGDIEFNYSSMEIVKHYPDLLELRYPHFIRETYSTRYFEKCMLDNEYEITKELTVFYSADKQKCVEWLQRKRETLLQSYKYNCERLEKSEVKEVVERT